jgi:5-oxoprolinase (ATP-hydrolysing) subunit C
VALLVVRPGLSTTVQDLGRPGYRGFGVPVGGAFDRASLDLANALLGNEPDAAALELTLVGGTYRAEVPLAIALAGAPMSALIRARSGTDRPLTIPQSATLRPGDELVLGGSRAGARTYLAVRGGWQTTRVLGSRSGETRLEAGAVLPALPGSTTPARRPVAWPWSVPVETIGPIRIIDGPDAGPSAGGAQLLVSGEFRVSGQSNRMGLRLEGPSVEAATPADRISAPVVPGAIQIAGHRPIVLGVASGTMGGYLHLAHVISADLDRLGQLRPGDPITFRRVEVEEARQIDRRRRLELARWLALIRTQDSGLRTQDSGPRTQDWG